MAFKANKSVVSLCLTRRTLPAHPLPRTRSISKSSMHTLRWGLDFLLVLLEASDLRGFLGRRLGPPLSLALVLAVAAEIEPLPSINGESPINVDSGAAMEEDSSPVVVCDSSAAESGMNEREILCDLSGSADWDRGMIFCVGGRGEEARGVEGKVEDSCSSCSLSVAPSSTEEEALG